MRGLIRGCHFLQAAEFRELLTDHIFRQEKMGRRSGALAGCVCVSRRSKAEVSVGEAMQAAPVTIAVFRRPSRDFATAEVNRSDSDVSQRAV